MQYTLEMKLYVYASEGLSDDTSVEFSNIPEPLEAIDLVQYFLRFCQAADFQRQSLLDAMYTVAVEDAMVKTDINELLDEPETENKESHIDERE